VARAMDKTMGYKYVEKIHVVVHTADNPSNAEWDDYLHDIGEKQHEIQGVVVYSAGGGPNAAQRSRLTAVWGNQKNKPVALMSSSRIFRGLITALVWVMPKHPMRVFAVDDMEGACGHVRASPSQRSLVEDTIASLKRELGMRDAKMTSNAGV
jgi:hypothetical protein